MGGYNLRCGVLRIEYTKSERRAFVVFGATSALQPGACRSQGKRTPPMGSRPSTCAEMISWLSSYAPGPESAAEPALEGAAELAPGPPSGPGLRPDLATAPETGLASAPEPCSGLGTASALAPASGPEPGVGAGA